MGGGWKAAGYGAAALAPAIYDSLQPKQTGAPVGSNVDSDKGRQYSFNSGYDPVTQTQISAPSYSQISDAEANKRYWSHAAQGGLMKSYAAGGGVNQFDFAGTGGGSVMRMGGGGLSTLMDSQFREVLTRGQSQGAANADPGQQYSYDQDSGEYVKKMANGGITYLASGGKSRAAQLDMVSNAPSRAEAKISTAMKDQMAGTGLNRYTGAQTVNTPKGRQERYKSLMQRQQEAAMKSGSPLQRSAAMAALASPDIGGRRAAAEHAAYMDWQANQNQPTTDYSGYYNQPVQNNYVVPVTSGYGSESSGIDVYGSNNYKPAMYSS